MLIVVVSILTNKNVFVPSYNDLKFKVWKHKYFCTNLTNATVIHNKRLIKKNCIVQLKIKVSFYIISNFI